MAEYNARRDFWLCLAVVSALALVTIIAALMGASVMEGMKA